MISNQLNNRNFGLSKEAFEDLLARLKAGDESLFESIFLAHFNICLLFVKKKYQASQDAAYDAAMAAMVKMREMLISDKLQYGNLEYYMTQIAVTYHLKKNINNKELPTDIILDVPEDHENDLSDMLPVLDQAWTTLGEGCRKLLQYFYYDKIELKQLTTLLNDTSEANTRKKKERCLKELRKLFFEKL